MDPLYYDTQLSHAANQGETQVNIVLINPYELGRQPLAQPGAWLKDACGERS